MPAIALNPSLLDELLEMKPEDRAGYLMLRDPATRTALLQLWANDSRLRATDIVLLADPYRVELTHLVVGNPKKQMRNMGKVFYVKPAKADDVIELEDGTRGQKRAYIKIDRPNTMPAERAIQAIIQFGPTAEFKQNCGRLVEISAVEYSNWVTRTEVEKAQVQAMQAEESEKTEAEAALAKARLLKEKAEAAAKAAAQAEKEAQAYLAKSQPETNRKGGK